jgi:YidC/Oxa1 family membrane protein insertase
MLRVGVSLRSISRKLSLPGTGKQLTNICLKTNPFLLNLNSSRYFSGSSSSSQSDDNSTQSAPSSSWTVPPPEPDTPSAFPESNFNIDNWDKIENFDPTTIPIEHLDAALAASTVTPLGTNPIHLMMGFIDNIHTTAGIPYWEAIMIGTIALRIALIYPAIYALQNTNRMQALRPKMTKLQEEMNTHPNAHEIATKMEYQRKMTQLMTDHNVNPVRSIAMPLFQLPIFISIFFALRDMGSYFPEFASGGALWFTDLSAQDPMYILPVVNALTFFVMVEIGSSEVQGDQKDLFKWVHI